MSPFNAYYLGFLCGIIFACTFSDLKRMVKGK